MTPALLPHRAAPGRTVRYRVGAVLAGMTAITFTLVGPAPAALAHTSLKSSNPAADSTVDQPPTSVELVFAGAVSSPDPKIAITIAGYDPVEVPAAITGTTVTADLTAADIPGLSTATYPVVWTMGYRLIAADGDPFSGLLNFTVATAPAAPSSPADTPTSAETAGTAAPPTSVELTSSSPTTPSSVETERSATSTAAAATASTSTGGVPAASTPASSAADSTPASSTLASGDADDGAPLGWIIGGLVAAAAVVAAVLLLRRRTANRRP